MATKKKVSKKDGQGMNAEPLVVRLNQLQPKELRLLSVMILHGAWPMTLADMGRLAFEIGVYHTNRIHNTLAGDPVQANSWARNSKRKLVRAGFLRKVCKSPATYEVTIAPIGKQAMMRTDIEEDDDDG